MVYAVQHTLFERTDAVLARIRYRDWTLVAEERAGGEVRVEASHWPVNSFQQTQPMHIKMSTWIPQGATDRDIINITFRLVKWLELHEAGEFFQVDGIPPFNSHNGRTKPEVYAGLPVEPNDIGIEYMKEQSPWRT